MSELALLLRIYSVQLPPLGSLTPDDRKQLIEVSRQNIFAERLKVDSRSVQGRVEERAYHLYLRRDRRSGPALDDWLEAEQFIREEDNTEHGYRMA